MNRLAQLLDIKDMALGSLRNDLNIFKQFRSGEK